MFLITDCFTHQGFAMTVFFVITTGSSEATGMEKSHTNLW
jgi:hypothetical protein